MTMLLARRDTGTGYSCRERARVKAQPPCARGGAVTVSARALGLPPSKSLPSRGTSTPKAEKSRPTQSCPLTQSHSSNTTPSIDHSCGCRSDSTGAVPRRGQTRRCRCHTAEGTPRSKSAYTVSLSPAAHRQRRLVRDCTGVSQAQRI